MGVYFCLYRGMLPGTLVAFVLCVNLLMSPLAGLMQLNLLRANAQAGLERIMAILNQRESTVELPVSQQRDPARQAALARASGSWRSGRGSFATCSTQARPAMTALADEGMTPFSAKTPVRKQRSQPSA